MSVTIRSDLTLFLAAIISFAASCHAQKSVTVSDLGFPVRISLHRQPKSDDYFDSVAVYAKNRRFVFHPDDALSRLPSSSADEDRLGLQSKVPGTIRVADVGYKAIYDTGNGKRLLLILDGVGYEPGLSPS